MSAFQVPVATSRSVTGIPTGRLAIWWVLASEVVIFGGLVTCYILFRLHHSEWAAEAAHTKLAAGAFNTFVLLTSSLFVVLAHLAASKKDTANAKKYLIWTILGGLVFLCVKAYEYTSEISHGFTITRSVFWGFYYTATALHAVHVIGGMTIMGIILPDVAKGRHLPRVEYIGIYWHFVDVVWLFLFPLFYIASAA